MTDPFPAFASFHPFGRLDRLLAGIEPARDQTPLALSIGEPQGQPPAFVADVLAREAQGWGRYPPAKGTPAFRQAVHDWLVARFGIPAGLVDPETQILPVAGSREALFMATQVAVARAGKARPAVLLPNPFYHVYAGAIAAAGAEPIFLPATRASGFLPALDAIDASALDRVAFAFVCSPSNPQGAVADRAYLESWIALARRHGFTVAFDECYSEIWRANSADGPPAGALEAAAALGDGLDNVLIVHSLSKRSGAPGLRSGFVAGDAEHVARQLQLINYGGVAVPAPIVAASTALWRDEKHVEGNRARYDAAFDAAAHALGNRFGYATPPGAFFAWLDVGDDEDAARRLWAEAALRVMPGRYMARDDASGNNPGAGYIRIALVHEPDVVSDAMTRLAETLDRATPRRVAGDAA